MRTLLFTAFAAAMTVSLAAHGAAGSPPDNQTRPAATVAKQPMTTLKIRIMVDGKAVIASLADNPTARDFYSLLPLTLTLNDYAATEKVAYLARKLSGDGAPAGAEPAMGDIAYYAPWGNLAIYYKDFAYSDGLIKLGTIDGGIDAFKAPGSLKVTIEASGP
ncbi:cyclophilin-like fold protein [Noviherbaspirillum sp.]|uniref:cyclophilin-like fold protein n=1 Tax=Noviherbaspirillum sp. TaxID=1926288 RepID=UPI002FDF6E6C